MARDVDRVIEYVQRLTDIPPVHRQIMVNRLDPPPTQDEIDRAAAQVYPTDDAREPDWSYRCPRCGWSSDDTRYEQHGCPSDDASRQTP